MSFSMQGQSYKLQGKMEGSLNLSDWEEMSRLLEKPNQLTSMQLISIAELWAIQGTACEQLESTGPFQHNSDLQELLLNFADVFEEPNGLPPEWEHDYKIELKEGINPISRRPYKYDSTPKDAIEKLINEMLDTSIIVRVLTPARLF